jgi:hypothetical protein
MSSLATHEAAPYLRAEATLLSAVDRTAATQRDVLDAVATLEAAPTKPEWDSALTLGLLVDDGPVVDRTIAACMKRFRALKDMVAQDLLLEKLLTHCFTSLSASPSEASGQRERRDHVERSAAKLIREITAVLREHPNELEPHRSRLLSHARRIQHIQGAGELSEAVVGFQEAISQRDGRSDHGVAERISRHRKLELYESPETSEATLLAYLSVDRALRLEHLSPDLFGAYRVLIATQSKERAPHAIRDAIANLASWLSQIPYDGRRKLEIVREIVGRAAVGVPWEELALPVRRHLELHHELLPGESHPEDLLRIAREKYSSPEGEEIFISLLQLFRALPLIRFRLMDLRELLTGLGHVRRSRRCWRELLDLVEALVTGLEEVVPQSEEVDPATARMNRARRELLAQDQELRAMLRRIAIDRKFRVSDDPTVELAVREQAWRILLRSQPPDRFDLLRQGVESEPHLLLPTIEESASAHRRDLWRLVTPRWTALIGAHADERRRKIVAIAEAFRRTAPLELIQRTGDRPAPLVALALDDGDPEVRAVIENAIVAAGYGLELDIVREQRRLEAIRNELEATRTRALEVQAQIDAAGDAVRRVDVQHSEQVVLWQGLREQRAAIETDAIIRAAETGIRLEELRVRTAEALRRVEIEEQRLTELAARTAEQVRRATAVAQELAMLVGRQRQTEQRLSDAQRELAGVTTSLRSAQSDVSGAEADLRRVQHSAPSAPARTSNPEEMERRNAHYQSQRAAHERQMSQAAAHLQDIQHRIQQLRRNQQACESTIHASQAELERLAESVRVADQRRRSLQSRIAELERETAVRRVTWEQLRSEVAALNRQTESVAAEAARAQARSMAQLAENGRASEAARRRIEAIEREMRELDARLTALHSELQRLQQLAQRLQHDFDTGLAHLDHLSEQSVAASALADRRGATLERQHELDTTELQQSLVQYAAGVRRALRQTVPPPTRAERERRRAEARRVHGTATGR